jgi:Tat protein translocase TatB subunit
VFNVGGAELIVILLIALVVLGPEKLPDAVRKAGRIYGEVRRMANGFQSELRSAIDEPGLQEMRDGLDEPFRAIRDTVNDAKNAFMTSAAEPVIKPGEVVQQSGGPPIQPSGGDIVVPEELPGEDLEGVPAEDGGDSAVASAAVAAPVAPAVVEAAVAPPPTDVLADLDLDGVSFHEAIPTHEAIPAHEAIPTSSNGDHGLVELDDADALSGSEGRTEL